MTGGTGIQAGLVVDLVEWDHPDATRLRTAQQAELRERYGDDDIGHEMSGDDIVAMLVLREDDEAVACVALRDATSDHGPGAGEVKRLYTSPAARGRGHSRHVMTALESVARDRGLTRLVLETGVLQPEAIGLYLALGYRSIANYGEYVDEPSSRCFERSLDEAAPRPPSGSVGAPAPGAVPSQAGARLSITTAAWDDEDARALRRAMWQFNAARYPELVDEARADGGFAPDDDRQGVGALVTWLALLDDEPVACLTMRAAKDGYPTGGVELKKMYVGERARGTGVARRLLATAEDEARQRGFSTIVLGTGVRQPEAITLYLSAGYRPMRPFTDPDGDFLTLWFAKPLR
jgi:GNAT superfamily N-acetyltransferase